jgi:hypothetical protein
MCLSRRRFIVGGAATAGLLALPSRSWSAASAVEATSAGDVGRLVLRPTTRLCDTRNNAAGWYRVDDRTIRVPLENVGNDTIAVAATITVVGGSRSGFITAFAAGTPRPTASLLNFCAGEVRANVGMLQVSRDGLDLFASDDCGLIVDIVGTFAASGPTAAGRYVAFEPTRLLDTRAQGAPFGAGERRSLAAPLPSDALAAVCNLTIVDTPAAGYWTAWAGGERPVASNVNADSSGQTRGALALVPLRGGSFDVFSEGGGHLVIDCVGYFTGPSAPVSAAGLLRPLSPTRVLDSRSSAAPFASGTEREVAIAETGGTAMVNVTMVQPTHVGFAALRPAGSARTNSSNVNAQVGATTPNAAISTVSDRGLTLYSNAASHYVVDLYGMFTGPRTAAILSPAGNVPFGVQNVELEKLTDEYYDIGASATGLPLRVFRLGSGPRVALVSSHVHGDEWTGESVIADIATRGPIAGWTLLLAPSMNPDARALNTRFVGVDMNRDFEAGWQGIATGTPSGCVVTGTGSTPYTLGESAAWRDALSFGALARAEIVFSHHDNYNWVAPQTGLPNIYRSLADEYGRITGLRTSRDPRGSVPTNTSWTRVPGGFETYCYSTGKPTFLIENKAGYGGSCRLGRFGVQPAEQDVSAHYSALTSLLTDTRLPR